MISKWMSRVFSCPSIVPHKRLSSIFYGLRFLSSTETSKSLDLSGIYPPIPTPFGDNEDIQWAELKTNLSKWENIPFKGYVVQGSNGEYVSLSHQERVEMVKFVSQNISKNKLILAGSGCEGTRETIKLTNQMSEAGADVALVVTPSFFKSRMTSTAMLKHYTTVAENSTIPIILYNVPSNTGIEFPLDAIIELAKHPNIIGLKDSGGNITNIGDVINETKNEDFQILAGSASFLLPAMTLGAVGGIVALGNVLGKECCELFNLIQQGRHEEAKQLQLTLIHPNQLVTRKYNVPSMKYAMELLGFYGGPCRSPLGPLSDHEVADIKKGFKDFI